MFLTITFKTTLELLLCFFAAYWLHRYITKEKKFSYILFGIICITGILFGIV